MKEPHEQGVANQFGPESCAGLRARLNFKVICWLAIAVAAFLGGRRLGWEQARQNRINDLDAQYKGAAKEWEETLQASVRWAQKESVEREKWWAGFRSAVEERGRERANRAKREAEVNSTQQ